MEQFFNDAIFYWYVAVFYFGYGTLYNLFIGGLFQGDLSYIITQRNVIKNGLFGFKSFYKEYKVSSLIPGIRELVYGIFLIVSGALHLFNYISNFFILRMLFQKPKYYLSKNIA